MLLALGVVAVGNATLFRRSVCDGASFSASASLLGDKNLELEIGTIYVVSSASASVATVRQSTAPRTTHAEVKYLKSGDTRRVGIIP